MSKLSIYKIIRMAFSHCHVVLVVVLFSYYMIQYCIETRLIADQQGRSSLESIGSYYLTNGSCIHFNSSLSHRLEIIRVIRPSISSMTTINMATNLSAIIISIVLANWSDRFGYRSAYLLVSIIGLISQAVITLITVYADYNLNVLIYGSLISSLSGGLPTLIFSIFTIVGEGCPQKYQGLQWATLIICWYTSHAFSILSIFRWLAHYNFIVIVIVCICLYVSGLIYTLVFIHPKYYKRHCSKKETKIVKLNIITELLISFSIAFYALTRERKYELRFRLLLVSIIFSVFSYVILTDLVNIYLVLHPYCWTIANAYTFESIRLIGVAIGGMFGWLFLRKYLRDSILANASLTCVIAPLGMIALATPHHWLLFGSKIFEYFL